MSCILGTLIHISLLSKPSDEGAIECFANGWLLLVKGVSLEATVECLCLSSRVRLGGEGLSSRNF